MTAGVHALALTSSCLLGAGLVLGQLGLRHAPPALGALITLPAMTTVLWFVASAVLDWRQLTPTAAVVFIGAGLLFPGLVTMLTYEANRRMGPAIAGALGNLAPLFAVPVAVLALGEPLGPLQAVAMTTILIGVVMLSVEGKGAGRSWHIAALAIPLAASALRGVTQPVIKIGLEISPSPLAAMLLTYTTSCLVVSSVTIVRTGVRVAIGRAALLWFLGVGFCNGMATWAMYAALEQGPVATVSPLIATYPVAALVLSKLVPKSEPTPPMSLAGIFTTVAGVCILVAS